MQKRDVLKILIVALTSVLALTISNKNDFKNNIKNSGNQAGINVYKI